ncbi:MAG: hypothetical protein ACRD2F_14770 [Terriglobales bacterium]
MNCRECRSQFEVSPGPDWPADVAAHVRGCPACAQLARLRTWSRGVVQSGAILAPEPPPMAAVWASIRRQSGAAWEGSLLSSFRRLVPYLASITVLCLLAGSLALGGSATAASGSPSIPSLLAPATQVANSMPVNTAIQSPSDWLGLGAH